MAQKNGMGTQVQEGSVTLNDLARMLTRMGSALDTRLRALEDHVYDGGPIEATVYEVTSEHEDASEALGEMLLVEEYVAEMVAEVEAIKANPPDPATTSFDEVQAWYQRRSEAEQELADAEQALADMREELGLAGEQADAGDDSDDIDAEHTVAPGPNSLIVSYRPNERSVGRLKDDLEKGGLTFPKGSLVTLYENEANRWYARVWTEVEDDDGSRRAVSRTVTKVPFLFTEFDTDTGQFKRNYENIRRISRAKAIVGNPDKQGKRKRRTMKTGKAHRLQASASMREYLENQGYAVIDDPTVYPAGTPVQERKNGTKYIVVDKRARSLSKQDARDHVKNGKTTREFTSAGEHFTKKMRGHVERHASGGCNCQVTKQGKISWLCTAMQKLGPESFTVGAVTHVGYGGPMLEGAQPFDPTADGVSSTLLGKLNDAAWGIS